MPTTFRQTLSFGLELLGAVLAVTLFVASLFPSESGMPHGFLWVMYFFGLALCALAPVCLTALHTRDSRETRIPRELQPEDDVIDWPL